MSECPIEQPAGDHVSSAAPVGHARMYVVPERPPAMSPDESAAHLAQLRDRLRRDADIARRHGLLGRYDVPDDPNNGVSLYEAVALQDTSELNDSGWLDRVVAINRLKARLAALEAEATAGFECSLRGVSADLGHRYPEPGDRTASPDERRWVAGDLRSPADELALVWQISKGAATTRLHASCELVDNFPASLHALKEGELTERAAFTVVRELSVLDDAEQMAAAESAVLDWARKHPPQQLRKQAQREAARRSPEATGKAHARAMDERSVRIFPSGDGTAELVHTQDAIDAAAVMSSLTRAAASRRRHGDTRTMDQLRSDIALSRLLPRTRTAPAGTTSDAEQADDGGDLTAGAETTVIIHATGEEIRALINGEPGSGGEAEHHGPLPQGSLRKHLVKALGRALLPAGCATDTNASTGRTGRGRVDVRLIDEPPAGRSDSYVPTAQVDKYVRLRDRTCQFPGCNRPAEYADLDHRIAFAEGGRTTTDNLHCLCRHHHRLKHHGGWTVTPDADETTVWTSPTGRSYRTPPPDPDRFAPPCAPDQ